MIFIVPDSSLAQVTDIRYTLAPTYSRVNWADDAGLKGNRFLGGELGLGVGEYLEVSGIFLWNNTAKTDFSKFPFKYQNVGLSLADVPARKLVIQRMGAKMQVNLKRGALVPFVHAGTGIIRFDPKGLPERESIYAQAGAGFSAGVARRYLLSVSVENLVYRLSPGLAFYSPEELQSRNIDTEVFDQRTVYNPAFSASLKLYLGGRSEGSLTDVDRALMAQWRGEGLRLALEPFYGQVNFHKKLNFEKTQPLAGINAGVNLGPHLGLRGFYWRTTKEDKLLEDGVPTKFGDLTFYGGEMDLQAISLTQSFVPYLLLGGGYLDIEKGTLGRDGEPLESRYFAIGGAGIDLALIPELKLRGDVRGLFMSAEDLGDLSDPGSVFISPMYTLGLSLHLGGRARRTPSVLEEERYPREDQAALEMERYLADLRFQADSLRQVQDQMIRSRQQMMAQQMRLQQMLQQGDTLGFWQAMPEAFAMPDTVGAIPGPASNISGKTITIPVPEEGEIYIRFGSGTGQPPTETTVAPPIIIGYPPAGMVLPPDSTGRMQAGASDLQAMMAEMMDQRQQAQEKYLAALEARLRRMEERTTQALGQLRTQLTAQETPTVVIATEDTITVAPPPPQGLVEIFNQRQLVAALPMVGVRVGEGNEQFLVAVRADYRFPEKPYRFMPELGLTFGDGVGLNALGNVAWSLKEFEPVQPYVGTGVGFVSDKGLSGFDLVLNLFGGVEYTNAKGQTFFGEYSTLDVFDFHRLLIGYRFRF